MDNAELLRRNRYDPNILLSQLAAQTLGKDVNEWCYKFKCADEDTDDFLAYVSGDTKGQEESRSRLVEFLTQIRDIDNSVQASLEAEYQASGFHLRNYKLHIGWLSVADPIMTVRYWGTAVNTEWEIKLVRTESGKWIDRSHSGASTMYCKNNIRS